VDFNMTSFNTALVCNNEQACYQFDFLADAGYPVLPKVVIAPPKFSRKNTKRRRLSDCGQSVGNLFGRLRDNPSMLVGNWGIFE
jgi:hypothetical protein